MQRQQTRANRPRAIITVNQNGKDPDFKHMIRELQESTHPDNLYYGRSDSAIVKMLIRKKLYSEHARFVVKRQTTTSNSNERG
jgi:hypothetical protein